MAAHDGMYYRYWGKTQGDKEDRSHHLLVYHSLDVAAVGLTLIDIFPRLFAGIARSVRMSLAELRLLFGYLLLFHDIGKFSSAFQALVPDLFARLFGNEKKRREYELRHDTLGFVLWRETLRRSFAATYPQLSEAFTFLADATFGHHGVPPFHSAQGGTVPLRYDSFFDADDLAAAQGFLSTALELFPSQHDLDFDVWELEEEFLYASWRIAGLCTLADWIGSNGVRFSFYADPMPLGEYWKRVALPAATRAVRETELAPCRPRQFAGIERLFPKVAQPTSLQAYLAEVEILEGPSLWIIEDTTGSGKTEAAITLAQRLMASSRADGIYVALPTMATANAMYTRMGEAYRRLYDDEATPSLVLSHGSRHLSKGFRSSIGLSVQDPVGSAETEASAAVYCNEWIADNRKKALFASVGVGTVDQALLAVLPARHQTLRLLGLQRKIVILDEVHAYDTYMSSLLAVLLEEHARSGGSVILLSATIPERMRRKLTQAYLHGLAAEPARADSEEDAAPAFPLVSSVGANHLTEQAFVASTERQREVCVRFVYQYGSALNSVVEKSHNGSCVCWIRNTVDDAKRAYGDLVERGVSPDRIDLFHSRFAMVDRVRIEERVVRLFGENSSSTERRGRILIATQVVEQSLDLDFDFMISDLAPIDLLIQRAGRLHRHLRDAEGNRISSGTDGRGIVTLFVFAPEFSPEPPSTWPGETFRGTLAVYAYPGRLWLTQRILEEKGRWIMPDDARTLIEYVYGEGSQEFIPDALEKRESRAIGEDHSKRAVAELNALRFESGYCRENGGVDLWDDEHRIMTRLGGESVEVVLVVDRDGALIPYADVGEFAWDFSTVPVSVSAWERVSYEPSPTFAECAEELKTDHSRLKHSQIVMVPCRHNEAHDADWADCAHYDPRFGWGGGAVQEA